MNIDMDINQHLMNKLQERTHLRDLDLPNYIQTKEIYVTSNRRELYLYKLKKIYKKLYETDKQLLRFKYSNFLNQKIKKYYNCRRFKGFSDFSQIQINQNCLKEDDILTVKSQIVKEETGKVNLYMFIDQNKPSIDSNKIENNEFSIFQKIKQFYQVLNEMYSYQLSQKYKKPVFKNNLFKQLKLNLIKLQKLKIKLNLKELKNQVRSRKIKNKTSNFQNYFGKIFQKCDTFQSTKKSFIDNNLYPCACGGKSEGQNVIEMDQIQNNEEDQYEIDSESSCCSFKCVCNQFEENYQPISEQDNNLHEIENIATLIFTH